MQGSVTPVPWVVAETVALKVATLRPKRVAVTPDDARLRQAVMDASSELALDIALCEVDEGMPVDLLVWRSLPDRPTVGARQDLLARAGRSRGDIVICERIVDAQGLGGDVLAAIDPHIKHLATDEVDDEAFGVRERKSWEAPTQWVVAEAAAWRFLTDAEMARGGFLRRLSRMSSAEMVMTCRRILSRFDCAHELLMIALRELVVRRDTEGAEQLRRELRLHPGAAPSVQHRAAELLTMLNPVRTATQQLPVAV